MTLLTFCLLINLFVSFRYIHHRIRNHFRNPVLNHQTTLMAHNPPVAAEAAIFKFLQLGVGYHKGVISSYVRKTVNLYEATVLHPLMNRT